MGADSLRASPDDVDVAGSRLAADRAVRYSDGEVRVPVGVEVAGGLRGAAAEAGRVSPAVAAATTVAAVAYVRIRVRTGGSKSVRGVEFTCGTSGGRRGLCCCGTLRARRRSCSGGRPMSRDTGGVASCLGSSVELAAFPGRKRGQAGAPWDPTGANSLTDRLELDESDSSEGSKCSSARCSARRLSTPPQADSPRPAIDARQYRTGYGH